MFSYKSLPMRWILSPDVLTEALLVREIDPDAIRANDEEASRLPELRVPIDHYTIEPTANLIFCAWMIGKELFRNNDFVRGTKAFAVCVSVRVEDVLDELHDGFDVAEDLGLRGPPRHLGLGLGLLRRRRPRGLMGLVCGCGAGQQAAGGQRRREARSQAGVEEERYGDGGGQSHAAPL